MCKSYEHAIVITNRILVQGDFLEQMEKVIALHPHAVILREKDLEAESYLALAAQVLDICHKYNVPCILHTFWKEAIALGCTSIHLPLPLLRRLSEKGILSSPEFASFTVLGTSVHSVAEAREAEHLGVTYLTAGHIYVTDCKKGLAPRGLHFLQEVCKSVSVPVYGIGGIKFDPVQWQELQSAGATGGCIMSGMMEL